MVSLRYDLKVMTYVKSPHLFTECVRIQLSPLVREKNRFYVLGKTLFIKQTVSLGYDLMVTTYVNLPPSLHRKRPNSIITPFLFKKLTFYEITIKRIYVAYEVYMKYI